MSDHYSIPIIRLEVEGMRHSMVSALTQHQALMDESIRKAVDDYCQPENIQRVIDEAAHKVLNHVIREEVSNFFRFGEGRKDVAAAVKEALLNRETYTPLDEVENPSKS